jgi:nicotinate-nucleotide adenylyltransferase
MSKNKRAKRIGVFGGTFDPPHMGHLIIADQARAQLHLDKVLFVPAHIPPHKMGKATASPLQRLMMTRKAIRGIPEFEASSIEIGRKGVSYTIDTLRHLKSQYADATIFLIVGGDNFAQLKSWKDVRDILRLSIPVVYDREAKNSRTVQRRPGRRILLQGAALTISSTLIRQRLKSGQSIRFLVPPAVERYIRRHRLYR